MCMYMQLNTTNTIFFNHNKGKNKNSEHPGIKRKKKSAYTADFFAYVAE